MYLRMASLLISLTAAQFSSRGTSEKKTQMAVRVNQRLNAVENARNALHFINEDDLLRGRQGLRHAFDQSRIVEMLPERLLVGQIH